MADSAGVAIRPGRAGELAALAAVVQAALEAGPSGCRQGVPVPRLTASQGAGLLWTAADEADRPVGFAAATIADDTLHIVALAVARTHWRRGIGRALIERAIDHGRWAFFPAVTVTADAAAPWGAPFLRRLGFVALAAERLPPDLAAFLGSERAAFDPHSERIAMAKVL